MKCDCCLINIQHATERIQHTFEFVGVLVVAVLENGAQVKHPSGWDCGGLQTNGDTKMYCCITKQILYKNKKDLGMKCTMCSPLNSLAFKWEDEGWNTYMRNSKIKNKGPIMILSTMFLLHFSGASLFISAACVWKVIFLLRATNADLQLLERFMNLCVRRFNWTHGLWIWTVLNSPKNLIFMAQDIDCQKASARPFDECCFSTW
jgi:hypothetical protein